MNLSRKTISKLTYRLLVSIAGDIYFFIRFDLRRRLISESFNQYIEYKKYPYYLITGNAISFCYEDARLYCIGKGIDVGGGAFGFPGARLVENNQEENAMKILENDNSLDYVFSSHCLEHLDKNAQSKFISEASRCLKAGGIFYIYMPSISASQWDPKIMSAHKLITSTEELIKECKGKRLNPLKIHSLTDSYLSKRLIFIKQDE